MLRTGKNVTQKKLGCNRMEPSRTLQKLKTLNPFEIRTPDPNRQPLKPEQHEHNKEKAAEKSEVDLGLETEAAGVGCCEGGEE